MVVINNTKKGQAPQAATVAAKSVTARLLVLGDKQVGKSASIVRYTTGRFIQEYSDASSDWLYKHPIGFDSKKNQSISVEILEQRDVDFCNSGSFFLNATQTITQNNQHKQSLASRVALDQQLASELHEKQEMLNKLHWADAYIVIYAINDKSSFNKAIKYLNLIANNINSPTDNHRHSCSSSSCSSSSTSSTFAGNTSSTTVAANNGSSSSNFFHRLSSPSQLTNGGGGISKLSPNHLAGSCNNHTSSNCRRPILLLGNKRDLEKSDRQVSASDGRLLAMRHQSLFAEVSIAESNKLIDSFLCNLVDQIDHSLLHPDNSLQQPQQVAQLDNQSLIRQTAGAILGQSSIQLAAPVWGSLVKSNPVASTMMAQSSNVKLRASSVHSLKPVVLMAKSVEVGATARLQVASTCSLLKRNSTGQSYTININRPPAMQCSNPTPISTNNNSYQTKYKTLKSSFKRASMAIVSSKALARNSNKHLANQKRSSTTSSEQDSIISELNGTPFTIKTHESDSALPLKSGTLMSDRFKRPLFRYRNRRTTVALEEIGLEGNKLNKSQLLVTSALNHSKLSLNKSISPCVSGYDTARNTSTRSSSSLSNSDTNYSSALLLCDLGPPVDVEKSTSAGSSSNNSNHQHQTANLSLVRHNSNTTLSHASTSGGSYEDSGDELASNSTNSLKAMKTQRKCVGKHQQQNLNQSPPTNKKRYHLVKSVQSTLSNLTRSSNISGPAPAKRSFCSTIFRHTQPATVTVKKITEPPVMVDVAKTEHLGPRPVMVGFCK